MELIWVVIQQAQALIGGRVVILECQDTEKLVNAYKNEGFTVLYNEDPNAQLLTLYTVIKS